MSIYDMGLLVAEVWKNGISKKLKLYVTRSFCVEIESRNILYYCQVESFPQVL